MRLAKWWQMVIAWDGFFYPSSHEQWIVFLAHHQRPMICSSIGLCHHCIPHFMFKKGFQKFLNTLRWDLPYHNNGGICLPKRGCIIVIFPSGWYGYMYMRYIGKTLDISIWFVKIYKLHLTPMFIVLTWNIPDSIVSKYFNPSLRQRGSWPDGFVTVLFNSKI